ncbi:MAG: ABC transporter ATP-binding protein [Candidatus Omnitrophica bacterium]|nr:ABC transporter ATP-binding protein [Candidatus Omnitrophota bacterium]
MTMSLIAQSVYKVYKSGDKEVRAVDGITLEVERSRSIAILGPSGAGKSTLLHLLGGLDRPTEGRVFLDGTDIAKLKDAEISRARNARIGFVFQFYHLLSEFTVLENVMLPAFIKSKKACVRDRDIRDKASSLLKSVGLESRIDHKPTQLSGGESQRVAIARALINNPDYLLCDEPTGNLDSKNSKAIYELLFNLKKSEDIALVIVTHDESISLRTESTIRIRDGKISHR